jgi:RNA polymerase sigma factor (sigma-70 family)
MTDPWPEYLERFAGTLARPSRTWSEAEAAEVWRTLARGPVGYALYATIRKRIPDQDAAEEFLQNLLAQLSIGRTYDPAGKGPESFRTWVAACLHHHFCHYFAGEKKEHERLDRAADVSDHETAALLTDKGRSAQMVEAELDARAMLDSLAPNRRDILQRHLGGETAEEIAGGHDLTPGNVRQILSRTNRDLRKKFVRVRQ